MKKQLKITEMTQKAESGYTSSAVTVQVPDNDTDIMVKLPNGRYMELQWRVESQCVDVCMDKHSPVHNWSNDMAAAKPVRKEQHVRNAIQLVIDMGIRPQKAKKSKKRPTDPNHHLKMAVDEMQYLNHVQGIDRRGT